MAKRSTPSPSTRPLTGCCGFGYDINNYFKRLSAVEYQQTFFNPPGAAALKRLRRRAPEGFAFVVRAWQLITHEPTSPGYRRLQRSLEGAPGDYGHLRDTPAVAEALDRTLLAAELLEATAVLFETPASFTPTATHRRLLSCFFERAPRRCRFVWDPRGVWEVDEVHTICRDLEVIPCCDPFANALSGESAWSLPQGELAYVKLSGLGAARHYSEMQTHWLADALRAFPRAYCMFNTINMFQDAVRFEGVLSAEALDSGAK